MEATAKDKGSTERRMIENSAVAEDAECNAVLLVIVLGIFYCGGFTPT